MASSYYNSSGPTLVEQRGATAVLGSGTQQVSLDSIPTDPHFTSTTQQHTQQRHVPSRPGSLASRTVARRKLRRSENGASFSAKQSRLLAYFLFSARLAFNPHVVRPSLKDYNISYNECSSPFPLPPEAQKELASKHSLQETASSSKHNLDEGPFSMSHSDAHWFLTHRAGFKPYNTHSDDQHLGAIPLFVKQAQSALDAWLAQDVFVQPQSSNTPPTTVIDVTHRRTGIDIDRDLRIFEIARTHHNLVWNIPDPFLRLIVHCLARTMACPTFSKGADPRHTWILKGKSYLSKPQAQMRQPGIPSDLETPPATDIGSEIASDVASETESDWAISEATDNEAEANMHGDAHQFQCPIEEEDEKIEEWADVEYEEED